MLSIGPRQLEISQVMLIVRASEPSLWNLHDIFCKFSPGEEKIRSFVILSNVQKETRSGVHQFQLIESGKN